MECFEGLPTSFQSNRSQLLSIQCSKIPQKCNFGVCCTRTVKIFWKVFQVEKDALEEPSTEEYFISKIFSIYPAFFAHIFLIFRAMCQCVTKIDFSVDRGKNWHTHTSISTCLHVRFIHCKIKKVSTNHQ